MRELRFLTLARAFLQRFVCIWPWFDGCALVFAHANLNQRAFSARESMSLQALIDPSRIRDLSREGSDRLEQARQRQRDYDRKIEKQVANKAVGHALLAKTCSL